MMDLLIGIDRGIIKKVQKENIMCKRIASFILVLVALFVSGCSRNTDIAATAGISSQAIINNEEIKTTTDKSEMLDDQPPYMVMVDDEVLKIVETQPLVNSGYEEKVIEENCVGVIEDVCDMNLIVKDNFVSNYMGHVFVGDKIYKFDDNYFIVTKIGMLHRCIK